MPRDLLPGLWLVIVKIAYRRENRHCVIGMQPCDCYLPYQQIMFLATVKFKLTILLKGKACLEASNKNNYSTVWRFIVHFRVWLTANAPSMHEPNNDTISYVKRYVDANTLQQNIIDKDVLDIYKTALNFQLHNQLLRVTRNICLFTNTFVTWSQHMG